MATTAAARTSRPVKRPAQSATKTQRRTKTLGEVASSEGKSILIHADTGVGKTVLSIVKAPRPVLVLDCDNGLDSVMGMPDSDKIDVWGPEGDNVDLAWKDMDEFRNMILGKWERNWATIVVDNIVAGQRPVLSSVQEELYARMPDDKKAAFDLDIPSQQAWGKIYRRLDRWVRDVRSAKRRGAHVIFTAGSAEWLDETAGYTKIYPNLEGKERVQIATHMDAVGWMEIEDGERILHLAPQGAVVTKVRLPYDRHDQVPEEIRDPDFESMMRGVMGLSKEEPKKAAAKKTTTRKRTK